MNLSNLKNEYDIVVAGGGITGAGVFHEAVNRGFRVLLVEARDFAGGTSSRSSKMVHGGLRYLKQGKFLLTRTAVKERERLIKKYPGLVCPLKFILPVFDHYGPSRSSLKAGLSIYSLMAGKKQHKSYSRAEAIMKIPGIRQENLVSAVGFMDAQVDDARLVMRLIYDACHSGGTALNYTKVTGVERNRNKRVSAVTVSDESCGTCVEIKTKVFINATGVFAEKLHPSPMKDFHIRPLRGSHLVFPGHCLPLDRVISFIHPQDLRPVFLFPWEGSVFLGTTDVDHDQDMNKEPFVTPKEADYLMEGLRYILPGIDLGPEDSICSLAGVRPVLSKKKVATSKESREHVVWKDNGLVTVTGGKLTTFGLLADDALKAAKPYLPAPSFDGPAQKVKPFHEKQIHPDISIKSKQRLWARYGTAAGTIFQNYDPSLFYPVEGTNALWVEICYAAEHEQVHNLSDLLLRRVRIGLFLPRGGKHLLDKVETLCQNFLPWDTDQWEIEKRNYIKEWNACYSPPQKRKGAGDGE